MSPTATSARVTLQPAALTHAAALGLRQELDRMVQQMKALAPDLRSVTVTLERSPCDPTEPPQILIDGREAGTARPATDLAALDAYNQWLINTYSGEVLTHFVFSLCPGPDDER